jgi:L-iditol 2-dehydrogenase
MGHEFAGVVAEVGPGVTRWKPGDRVTSETARYVCGQCTNCRTGQYNICEQKQLIGYVFDGCFTKYCVVPERLVHHLPDNIDFMAGALTEPLASCVNGVLEKTPIVPGDVVVVAGPGGIGLLSMQLAKVAGGKVVLCGTHVDVPRLELGKKLGADFIINVQEQDPKKFVLDLTNGEGAEVFLECSGAAPSVLMGLSLLRRGGKYTQIGLIGRAFPLEFDTIAYKELKVTGSLGQRWISWKRALALMADGHVNTKALISDVFPISQWEKAFARHEDKSGIKIVLTPED